LVAQSRDAPPAQSLCAQHDRQHRPAEGWHERAVESLQQAAQQQAGVQRHHRRIVPRTEFDAAAGATPGQIALRNNQFRDSFDRDRGDQ
jgi:hypothetical protein